MTELFDLATKLRGLTAADPDLGLARSRAHDAFDRLWQSEQMTRSEAYEWLAAVMLLSKDETHIEQFNLEQCRKVVRFSLLEYRRVSGNAPD